MIPYIGTCAEMQGLLCDKWKTRGIMQNDGVRIPSGQLLKVNDKSQIKMDLPFIIKPAREDNSLGVGLVKDIDKLPAALVKAFEYDDHVLVEEQIPGREIRVAVIPQYVIDNIDTPLSTPLNKSNELVVMPFLEYLFKVNSEDVNSEIRLPESKLQHDADGIPIVQNMSTFSSTVLPAEVSDDLLKDLSEQAKLAFTAMEGRHQCVFDFRVKYDKVTQREVAYFLEACSSAGFSPTSIVVKMANESLKSGGPNLTHPRLFQGVLKTAIRDSNKQMANVLLNNTI